MQEKGIISNLYAMNLMFDICKMKRRFTMNCVGNLQKGNWGVMLLITLFWIFSSQDSFAQVIFAEDFSEDWVVPNGYDFESPEGWIVLQEHGNSTHSWVKEGASAYHFFNGSPSNSWLISPEIFFEAGKIYLFQFQEKFFKVDDNLSIGQSLVRISLNGQDPSSFETDPIYTYDFEADGQTDFGFVSRSIALGPFLTDVNLSFSFQYIATGINYEDFNESQLHEWQITNVNVKEAIHLNLSANPSLGGHVWQKMETDADWKGPGNYYYTPGDEIELIASPRSGYDFKYWIINGEELTKPQQSITINQSVNAQAVFEPYISDLLWRQHTDGSDGNYDFDTYAGQLSSNGTIGRIRASNNRNEAAEDFANDKILSIQRMVFYGATAVWEPSDIEEFVIRLFESPVNASQAEWDNLLQTIGPVDGNVFYTGYNLPNNAKVYKIEIELDDPIESFSDGWITIQINQNIDFYFLRSDCEDGYSYQRSFSPPPMPLGSYKAPALKPYNLMFELWGELDREEILWVGGETSGEVNWHNPLNWNPARIPTKDDKVIIGVRDHFPMIQTAQTASVFSINIEENAQLTLQFESTLEVYENFAMDGILLTESESDIHFRGMGEQTISSVNPIEVYNLQLNNMSLLLNNDIEVNGILNIGESRVSFTNPNGMVQVNENGKIVYTQGRIVGLIRHHIPEAASEVTIDLPVGTMTHNRWVKVMYETNFSPGSNGYMDVEFYDFEGSGSYEPFGIDPDFDDSQYFYANVLAVNEDLIDDGIAVNTLSETGVWMIRPSENGNPVSNGSFTVDFCVCGVNEILQPDGLRILASDVLESTINIGAETHDLYEANWTFIGNHGGVFNGNGNGGVFYWIRRTNVIYGGGGTPGYGDHHYWALGSQFDINPLPIELYSFSATCMEEEVLVEWMTASEINNSHFVLERAYADGRFEAIARMEGAGNSTQLLHYQFTDQPRKDGGIIYYRLTQHDFDGQYETFAPIALQCNATAVDGQFRVYPNPASDVIHLSLQSPRDTDALAELYNLNGRKVLSEPLNLFHGHTRTTLNLEHLQPGIYLLRVTSLDVAFETQRVVVK